MAVSKLFSLSTSDLRIFLALLSALLSSHGKVKPRFCANLLTVFTRFEVSLTKEKFFLLEFLFPHVGFTMTSIRS